MLFEDVNVAVTVDNSGANGASTLRCMARLGIPSFPFDPTSSRNHLLETLRNVTHIVLIGHSSDFGTVKKLKSCSSAKLIVYWRGGDFWNTRENPKKRLRSYLTQCLIDDNWAVGSLFAQQIRSIGIRSKVVPSIIFEQRAKKEQLEKRILLYNPGSSGKDGVSPEDRYGTRLFLELAQKTSDYHFVTVGNGKLSEEIENISELGYQQDMKKVWPQIDFLFRVTDFEGLPKMIVEAAEYGVLSITRHPFFQGLFPFIDVNDLASRLQNVSQEEYQSSYAILHEEIQNFHSFDSVKEAYRQALKLH